MSDAIVPLDHQPLTAEEVAELLRLPVSTIYDLARTGRLPHLRIGRALRFQPERSRSAPRRALPRPGRGSGLNRLGSLRAPAVKGAPSREGARDRADPGSPSTRSGRRWTENVD